MLFVLLVISLIIGSTSATLTDQQRYLQLKASITSLQSNPTSGNLAKVDLIIKSTDYLKLQALYGP